MIWLRILIFVTIFYNCESYKILGVYHIPTGSHRKLATRLFEEIAKKGHEVTLITPYASKTATKNLREIPIESLQVVRNKNKTPTLDLDSKNPYAAAKQIRELQFRLIEHILKNDQVQDLMNSNEKFDAVIVYQYMNDGLYSLANHFKAPLILFSPMPLYVSESFLLGHPAPSSYVPNILTGYTGHMNFWERLVNSFYDSIITLDYVWNMYPRHRQLVREVMPGTPNLDNFYNNVSLLLINSHLSTNEAIPQVPNVVEIGGYHVEEPKPLPADLKTFLDDSKNGVVLFSMGSILRSADLPVATRDAVLRVFSTLKENVLWKWEDDDLPGLPKNVKVMKWLPQTDIMAHPNVKAFITHGGLLSTIESVYFAVPVVGIPIFADQKMNMAVAAAHGVGVTVPYRELSEKTLTWALDEVLNNPKYKNMAVQRSNIMRDRPLKPVDDALYWIEYVIRHKGATHLRYPGMDLNWFQRNLLDVAAFVVVVILLPFIVVIVFLKKLFISKSKSKIKSKKE